MRKQQLLKIVSVGFLFLVAISTANAALVSRLGGLAYYDTEADLTWLADANYAQTSGYDPDGLMNWTEAKIWAAGLTIDGVSGWRLAVTVQPDTSCDQYNGQTFVGYDCSASEMGNLFYNLLENSAESFSNSGPFSNIQSFNYWFATEYEPNTGNAWIFNMGNGYQNGYNKVDDFGGYAWAVYSGDISAVPVPAAIWLFGSGLLVLISFTKRRL